MLFFSTPSFGGSLPGREFRLFCVCLKTAAAMTLPATPGFFMITKPLVFLVSLLPLAWLGWLAWQGELGANPVETLSHHTGDWSLRFLLLTLAVTPARRLTGWNRLQQFRRMLGLFAFFYVGLHLAVYLIFDQFFDWAAIGADVVKRPYLTVGFAAFLLLIPLAITSTHAMMKRLGRHWQRLHRLVYLIAILGVLHYAWLVKADLTEPLLYGGILAALLGYRLWWRFRR